MGAKKGRGTPAGPTVIPELQCRFNGCPWQGKNIPWRLTKSRVVDGVKHVLCPLDHRIG